jgi:hypothetical protein
MAKSDNLITNPPRGPKAFAQDDSEGHQAQTAILLSLVKQFHVARRWMGVSGATTKSLRGATAASSLVMASWPQVKKEMHESVTFSQFPVPLLEIKPAHLRGMSSLFSPEAAPQPMKMAAANKAAVFSFDKKQTARLAKKCFADPNLDTAKDLVQSCLGHGSELVRVAAAIAAFPVTVYTQDLNAILVRGAVSRNRMVRELAVFALGIFDPSNPVLQKFLRKKRRGSGPPSHTSLLIHGTWARTEPWWQRGGDFHTYTLNNVRPDLYSAADRYDWTGAYSDAARDLAADELVTWFQNHPGPKPPSLFAHSHGANVAMLATWKGLEIDTLVLLSCPVYPNKYMPDFSKVSRVLSLHVTYDYVIGLDGGGQKFTDPNIEEWVRRFGSIIPPRMIRMSGGNMTSPTSGIW